MLVITARSNAIKDDGDDEVCAVRVTVYVLGRRFENEVRRFEPGVTREVPGLISVLGSKLT